MEYKQNQEAFNVMVKHLRDQGALSTSEGGGCAYRGQKGLKCAIGVLIKDEFYDKGIEGSCSSSVFLEALEKSGWVDVQNSMLHSTQLVHDLQDIHYWEIGFSKVADKYGLTVPKAD